MILPARRLALFVVAAIPFVLLPLGLGWSVGPLARAGARRCHLLLPDFSSGAETSHPLPSKGNASGELDDPPTDGWAPQASETNATPPLGVRRLTEHPLGIAIPSSTAAKRAATGWRARPYLFVGPESVQRAIPVAGRPTSVWTNRTLQHPAGLLIQSPGALSGVIEPGDILVEAEGKPLGSFEQLLVTVREAYERRAKRLSGRLLRKGDLVALTVEPGW